MDFTNPNFPNAVITLEKGMDQTLMVLLKNKEDQLQNIRLIRPDDPANDPANEKDNDQAGNILRTGK